MKFFKKSYAYASLFGMLLTGAFTYSMLKTFVLSEAITTVKPGDFVIVPFTHGCGVCDACRAGFDGSCDNIHINSCVTYSNSTNVT